MCVCVWGCVCGGGSDAGQRRRGAGQVIKQQRVRANCRAARRGERRLTDPAVVGAAAVAGAAPTSAARTTASAVAAAMDRVVVEVELPAAAPVLSAAAALALSFSVSAGMLLALLV